MGWFSDLFKAAPKAVDDVLDKENGLITQFGGWIGNQKFTPEEVSEMNTQTYADVRKFVIATLEESTDRSKTRRSMALLVMKFYISLLALAVILFPFHIEWSQACMEVATSWTLGGLVSSISIFFYGSHALAKHTESKKK